MTLPLVSILVFIALVAYAVVLEMRKRYAAVATPAPGFPVNPCIFYHTIKPLAVSQFGSGDSVRSSVVYECQKCTAHISAIYIGAFDLEDLSRKVTVEELDRMWGK